MFRIIERTGKKGRKKKKKAKQYSALPVYKAYTVRHGHTHTHTHRDRGEYEGWEREESACVNGNHSNRLARERGEELHYIDRLSGIPFL